MKKVKIIALVSAVATALLLFLFLSSLNQPVEIAKTSVLTAAADIPANTLITAEMVKVSELPPEAVVSGAITDVKTIQGKISQEEIYSGEQILNANLISAGESGSKTLAYAIKPGMRAITVPVDVTSGLANLITPGNHIDLIGEILTEKTVGGASQKKSYTLMILENITVLAVDDVLAQEGKVNRDPPTYATITLQVTSEQAMKLSMAQFEGQLRAILRSPLDEKIITPKTLTLDDILVY